MNSKLPIILLFICFFSQISISQTWVTTFNGAGNANDEETAICPDDSGNVYATGYTFGANSNLDITTVKFSSTGQILWSKTFNGSGNGDDRAFGIIIDNDGFIYVGGSSFSGGSGGEDLVLIKYNPAGTAQWTRTYGNISASSDRALGIVVDNAGGYIFLTGYTLSGENYDYLTVKYRNDGVFKWAKTYNRGLDSDDRAHGIVVDIHGNIIVTGSSQGSTSSYDYFTIKYDTDGGVTWTRRYDGANSGEDRAHGIVVDTDDNYTVTGYSMSTSSEESRDIVTIQYDKIGAVRWIKVYNGPDNLSDDAFGIIVDGSKNIYISGSTSRNQSSEDFLTLKYSPAGIEKWASIYNSNERTSDIALDIVVSANGNEIYVAGSGTNGGTENIEVVKYDAAGKLLQQIQYPGYGRANCLALTGDNNVLLGGFFSNSNNTLVSNSDYISMYFQGGIISVIGIIGNGNIIPTEYQLFQNYPNPFNPATNIVFDLPSASFVELKVFNSLGSEISSPVNSYLSSGRHSINFSGENLASGIYFYKLTTQNYIDTKKMILVK